MNSTALYKKIPSLLNAVRIFSLLFLLLPCLDCNRLAGPEPPLIVCDQNETPAPKPNAARFGFFAPEFYQTYPGHLDSLSMLFGVSPGYVLWFQQIDDPFPGAVVAVNTARLIRTVISLNIKSLSIDSTRNDTLLKEIALGKWDSTLAAFASGAAQSGVTIYLRFGYEMNGDWFPWGCKKEDFIAAWNHAHNIFIQESAENVRWIFSPNVVWDGRTVSADLLPYYPGDSVVDIIGVDGYNFGDSYDQWHHWQSFNEIFGLSLLGVKTLGKPLWITETGCVVDPRRPAWLEELLSFMDNNPCIDAVLWFNAYKTGEPDFRLESDSASLSLIRNWLTR
jgi:mannan endo-1,4-beta-mannosidase